MKGLYLLVADADCARRIFDPQMSHRHRAYRVGRRFVATAPADSATKR